MTRASRSRPRPVSVGRLLAVSFGGVVGAVALFQFWFFPARFETQASLLLQEDAQIQASVAAHSVRAGMVFDDYEAVEEALDGLFQDPMLRRVAVVGADGETVVERSRADDGANAVIGEAEIPFTGRALGTVHLTFSTARVNTRVAPLRRTVALVSTLIASLGLLAVLGISMRVARPLSAVAGTARRIAEGDEEGRAEVSGLHEVDDLATSFNAMVDRLQSARTEADDTRRRLQIILENLPGVIAVFDTGGALTFSRGREGYEPALADFPADMMGAVRACLDSGSLAEAECSCDLLGAEESWFHFAVSPIHQANGEVSGAVAYGTDVSDLRRAQAALEESEEQLRKAQKMEALGRLAGGVAHDFNNALTAIQGHAELALEDVDPAHPVAESLEVITSAAKHAASVTRRLLAFGRRQVLQPRELDLRVTLGDLAKLVAPMLGESIGMEVVAGTEPALVEVDPGQLDQALLNLCINAKDAMRQGGGTLTLALERVSFSEQDVEEHPQHMAGTWQVLVVSDTGVGMDSMTQTHLFEPFFSTKGPHQGTGLGLAMVHGFVTQSGGFVTAFSQEGQGSEFRIHLPIDGMPASVEAALRGDETRARVLLVDDEPAVLELSARVLRREGYTVVTAPSADHALEVCRTHPDLDLVVTDYLMPERTGKELAEDLSKLRPKLPVIFMSGHLGDACTVIDGVELPLIRKPFSRLDLTMGVQAALMDPVSAG